MTLQEMIHKKGLTNYKVAKMAGIGQATISELSSGKRKEPKLSTAMKIAKVLDVEVDKIYEAVRSDEYANEIRDC